MSEQLQNTELEQTEQPEQVEQEIVEQVEDDLVEEHQDELLVEDQVIDDNDEDNKTADATIHSVQESLEDKPEEKVEELPEHYNNDVYRDCKCTDDELRYQMIQDKLDRNITNPDDMDKHLYNFCDENLETRYRHVMGMNKVLPMETTKKHITLKLKKNTEKTRAKIAEQIDETFATYYPEKILTFINSTVTLLFIERMKDMSREFTCVHQGTYYKIIMRSEYHKVRFGRSYAIVNIDILTSKFE